MTVSMSRANSVIICAGDRRTDDKRKAQGFRRHLHRNRVKARGSPLRLPDLWIVRVLAHMANNECIQLDSLLRVSLNLPRPLTRLIRVHPQLFPQYSCVKYPRTWRELSTPPAEDERFEWEAPNVDEALARSFKKCVSFYDEPALARAELRWYLLGGYGITVSREGREGAPEWLHLQNGT